MKPAQRRPRGEREAHPSAHAPDGIDGNLSKTQHQQAGEGAQDLPLSGSRGLRVERPNQVWCVDITYLPMRRWFLYLVAIMDWHTRMVLSWRISNSLDADFCIEALNEAIYRFGPPDIMNSDQGSQFTSFA